MFTESITIDQVIGALGNFIQPFINGAPIIRGKVNRVPQPSHEFVVLTEVSQIEIGTPTVTYDESNTLLSIDNGAKIGVQVDIYNVESGNYCRAILASFRTDYAVNSFPAGIWPLYCSNATQMPLVTGEMQYESRWTFIAYMQYNPILTIPQDFPDELETNLFVNVDTTIA